MTVGYIVGVFDLFHYGHKNMLIESLTRCDRLIVGVHTDIFVKGYKRTPVNNQNKRIKDVAKYLKQYSIDSNMIFLMDDNHIELIKKYGITKIFHGNDWEKESYKKQIKFYEQNMDKYGVEIELIDYTKGISTTEIINKSIKNLSSKKCFMFDLDNTLILENKAMKFSIDIIDKLNDIGKDIYLITNNNRYSPQQIHSNLIENKININYNNVITSLSVINDFLEKNNYKNIFVWGSEQAKKYFINNSFVVNSGKHYDSVIVLYNNNFNYGDLVLLCNHIKNSPYIIGNIDRTYPDSSNILPDTGSVFRLIEYACNKPPIKIFGKPCVGMIEKITKRYKNDEIIFIGDSDITDRVLAERSNIDFLRVHKDGDISHLGVLCDYLNK